MTQTDGEYQKTFENEKARTVILLGFLSIILTIRVLLSDTSYFNFPWWCDNSCPHLTLLLLPTFTNWIISWLGYIGCMIVYVSEDRFDRYSWSRPFRERVRKIGHLFVWWYPVTVIFFSGFGGLSFNLPDSVQLAYWLTVIQLFAIYLVWTAGGVGIKFFGSKSFLNKPLDIFLEVTREGMQVIAEGLVRVGRGILAGLGSPKTGPPNRKRAMRIFISAIMLVVFSIAYFEEHLSAFNLSYALLVPLYAIIIASAIIGGLKKRRVAKPKTGA